VPAPVAHPTPTAPGPCSRPGRWGGPGRATTWVTGRAGIASPTLRPETRGPTSVESAAFAVTTIEGMGRSERGAGARVCSGPAVAGPMTGRSPVRSPGERASLRTGVGGRSASATRTRGVATGGATVTGTKTSEDGVPPPAGDVDPSDDATDSSTGDATAMGGATNDDSTPTTEGATTGDATDDVATKGDATRRCSTSGPAARRETRTGGGAPSALEPTGVGSRTAPTTGSSSLPPASTASVCRMGIEARGSPEVRCSWRSTSVRASSRRSRPGRSARFHSRRSVAGPGVLTRPPSARCPGRRRTPGRAAAG
jgi:hypothetical protein